MLNGWFLSIVAPLPLDTYIIPYYSIFVNTFSQEKFYDLDV